MHNNGSITESMLWFRSRLAVHILHNTVTCLIVLFSLDVTIRCFIHNLTKITFIGCPIGKVENSTLR
jgi:hypothetical protein